MESKDILLAAARQEAQSIDLDLLLRATGGHKNLLRNLLKIFQRNSAKYPDLLRDPSPDDFPRIVHALSNDVGALGFYRFASFLGRLETGLRQGEAALPSDREAILSILEQASIQLKKISTQPELKEET